jgi:hypothetical protein
VIRSSTGEVQRVPDEQADELIKQGWQFVPKRFWKSAEKKEESTDTGA